MKNKKTFGWYGKDKRKSGKRTEDRAADYLEDFYEEYGEDYDDDAYVEPADLDDDDAYIVEYESGGYEAEEYVPEEYETEEYASEEYETEEYASEEYEAEEYAPEEYETEEYEAKEYESDGYEAEEYEAEEYASQEYEAEEYEAGDFAEDTESYYEDAQGGYEDAEQYYEADEYADEYDDEDSFDIAYGDIDEEYEPEDTMFGVEPERAVESFAEKLKGWAGRLTPFDAILAATGVVLVVAAVVILSMFVQSKQVNAQIEAIAPTGSELSNMGIVGGDGLLAMADAALSGNFADDPSTESESEEESSSLADETADKVSVSFTSVEKDLKIRFTDANTGKLITGTVFEVTLTNAKGKKLVLTDDDMDGIIYAQNVNPGVFDAVVTSTDKYKFPTVPQQVTVKDKVEYVVINDVQDEVKKETQVNVAAEDTQKNVAAAEEVKLTDTVEWVESTKTPISGSENYLLVDKATIPDPSQTSRAAARMLFDTLNVSLDKTSLTLYVGESAELKGTSFTDSTEGDTKYQYSMEWKSSNEDVASVSGGKVTAKATGEADITYTVTRKTITTTYESKEETSEITIDDYNALSEEEQKNCTAITETQEGSDQVVTTGYTYKKTTRTETGTNETTDTASVTCHVTVKAASITSGSLELTKSADSCTVGRTLTVKPSKVVYTKQDGSTQTITENFPSITWESSDKAVATVDEKGVVTGVKVGTARITGKVTGVKDADGRELAISSSVEVSITAAPELSITLDRTKEVYIAVGDSTTLVATVANYKSDSGVTWETSDKKVATVDEKGKVTGVAAGSVTITATTKEKNDAGNQIKATCVVTVNSNASTDTTTKLKDNNGNQIYVKDADGAYKEAVYADYYTASDFYIKTAAQYAYTGWQTIDGKTYYYDKNGNPVTGAQVIQGVTYNFGSDGAIATTVNGSTFGIDVSRHNGTIDWNAVKASGVDFVIIRCGYRGSSTGVLIEDQNFRTNIKGATAAGLKVGVYVFSQAVNEVEAVKEASLAVSLVQGYNLTYPIFIDTESSGGRADNIDKATRTAVVNAFCQTVSSAGYKPGIYASKTWLEDKLNMGSVGNYKIWLAQYAAAPTYKGKYDMWQYSSKGKISGINGNVDLNYSYLGY